MDNSVVIAATLDAFHRMSGDASLVFLALPQVQSQPGSCVGYAFATMNLDLYIAMRRGSATWNISGSVGEIPFAVGSPDAQQVCGVADWQASLLSTQDTPWASHAWELIRNKYRWFKASHLEGDPMIIRLVPRALSLLRYDEEVDSLWRTTISFDNGQWRVDEHTPKTKSSTVD